MLVRFLKIVFFVFFANAEIASTGEFLRFEQNYEMRVPWIPRVHGATVNTSVFDGIVGLTIDSVLIRNEHFHGVSAIVPTDSFDGCGGHTSQDGQYHYHLPPLCVLRKLGFSFRNDGKPISLIHPRVVGIALDGFQIFTPSSDNLTLDECNGHWDDDEYRYYMRMEAPFFPVCFRGKILGDPISIHSQGVPCKRFKQEELHIEKGPQFDSLYLSGSGCPSRMKVDELSPLPAWLALAKDTWISELSETAGWTRSLSCSCGSNSSTHSGCGNNGCGCSSCRDCVCGNNWYTVMSDTSQVGLVIFGTFSPALFLGLCLSWKFNTYKLLGCVLFCWMYAMIPIPIIMETKQLSALLAAYWTFQTLSTIGYGDILLDSDELRLFVVLYVGLGQVIIFCWKKVIFDYGMNDPRKRPRLRRLVWPCFTLLLVVLFYSVYWGERFHSRGEAGYPLLLGLYFTMTSISTIGYGDLVPEVPADCIVFGAMVITGIPVYFFALGRIVSLMLNVFVPAGFLQRGNSYLSDVSVETTSEDFSKFGIQLNSDFSPVGEKKILEAVKEEDEEEEEGAEIESEIEYVSEQRSSSSGEKEICWDDVPIESSSQELALLDPGSVARPVLLVTPRSIKAIKVTTPRSVKEMITPRAPYTPPYTPTRDHRCAL